MQNEFEKRLYELGLSYTFNQDDFYTIYNPKGGGNHIIVRLIPSLHVNEQVHGSKNGNDIQAIGLFKFRLPSSGQGHDIFVFTFPNVIKNQFEFIIIPSQELLIRQTKKNPGSVRRKRVELVLWLMEDGFVYDTTNISPEGEWYFISNGVNGRMADRTGLDYSEYLDSWRRLNV